MREQYNSQSITDELDIEESAVHCWRQRRVLKTEFEMMAKQEVPGWFYLHLAIPNLVRHSAAVHAN